MSDGVKSSPHLIAGRHLQCNPSGIVTYVTLDLMLERLNQNPGDFLSAMGCRRHALFRNPYHRECAFP